MTDAKKLRRHAALSRNALLFNEARSLWPRHVHLAIIILADGRRFIDKRYLGVRIDVRVGAVTQEQAEERLRT